MTTLELRDWSVSYSFVTARLWVYDGGANGDASAASNLDHLGPSGDTRLGKNM
jgi:hypothetical protein